MKVQPWSTGVTVTGAGRTNPDLQQIRGGFTPFLPLIARDGTTENSEERIFFSSADR